MLPIIDSHVHLWNITRNRYPWLEPAVPEGPFGKTSAIRRNYLLEDYSADVDAQNVVGLVHVEAGWDRDDPFGEIRWVQDLADEFDDPQAHIAHIDLRSNDVAALLQVHLDFPVMRGVRDRLLQGDFTAGQAIGSVLDDPAWRKGLAIVGRNGLSFDLQAPPAMAKAAAELVAEFSDIQFVLTHAGYPPSIEDRNAYDRWIDGLGELAQSANVVVKLSGMSLSQKRWDEASAEDAFLNMLRLFGPERIMVASNSPVDRLFLKPSEQFAAYRRWIAALPLTQQEAVLNGTCKRIYRLQR